MTTCRYVPWLVKSQEIGCDLTMQQLCTLDLTVRRSQQVDHPSALCLHLKDCSQALSQDVCSDNIFLAMMT